MERKRPVWRRAAAALAGASLLWNAPGLGVYELFAAEVIGVQTGGGPVVGAVPILQMPGGTLSSPLGGLNTSISPSLQGSLPALSQPKVALSKPAASGLLSAQPSAPLKVLETWKAGAAAAQAPQAGRQAAGAAPLAPGAPIGKLGADMVERAEKGASKPQGLYNVFVQEVKGRTSQAGAAARPEAAPEAQYLRPQAGVLSSPSQSREWGEKSFDALHGDAVASRAPAVAPEMRPGVSRPMLRPALSVAEPGIRIDAPVEAAPQAPSKPKMSLTDIALTAIPILLGVMPLLDKIGLGALNLFAGMSFPAMLAVQIGVGLAIQIVKKQLKKRSEKKEKAAAEQKASVAHPTTTLDQDGALALLRGLIDSGRALEANIFDFTLGEFRTVPIDERLLAYVQAGAYHATTDDTGAVYLVPKLGAEPAAETPAAAVPADAAPAEKAPEALPVPAVEAAPAAK